MRNFDLYEFAGIILPGSLCLYALAVLFPVLKIIAYDNITIGGLGIFVILAYVCGHIIQAIGNIIEAIWWKIEGKPTDWIRTDKGNLLSRNQITDLGKLISKRLIKKGFTLSDKTKETDWLAITRQIYVYIHSKQRSGRADIFNANYGLCRGLVACLIVISLLIFIMKGKEVLGISLTLFVIAFLLFLRMRRFGIHYAREIFLQYLDLS